MATIRDRYILEVDTSGAERNMNSARGAIGGMAAGLARLGPLAVAAGSALAGMAAIQGIGNTINEMDDLAKAARQAGSAATEADFTQFQVFGQLLEEAGVGADRFSLALTQTQDRLAKGGGQVDSVIEKLGSSLRDMNGELLGGPELLERMILAFNQGEITAEEFQATVGTRVGPEIIRALGDTAASAESMAAAFADVEANSNIISLDAASDAEAFNDTMSRLGEVAGQLGTQITTALLPILLELAEGALAVLPGFIDGVKDAFARMEPFLRVIGTVFTELVVPVLTTFFDLISGLATVLEPVISLLADGLVKAIQAVGDILETVIGYVQSFIENLGAISQKVSEITGAVGSRFTDMKDGIVDSTEAAYKGVTGWFSSMYEEIVGNSIVPEMTSGVLGSFDELSGGMVSRIAEAIPAVINRFQNIAQTIGDNFERLTGISLSNIRTQVGNLASELGNRVESLATSISTRFQGIRDSVSGFANRIGAADLFDEARGVFAGLFANGGFIPPGQFGIVGERGPELISGPAQITPLDAVGSGANQNISYYIDAVDARSFKEMIARDPGFIHAVAQRGGNAIPGGRR